MMKKFLSVQKDLSMQMVQEKIMKFQGAEVGRRMRHTGGGFRDRRMGHEWMIIDQFNW